MVLKQDGSLWATGINNYGQLGPSGWSKNKERFIMVIPSGVKAVTAGSYHTMAVKTDGSLWGTGYDENGQLGDGPSAGQRTSSGTYYRTVFVKVATNITSTGG